MKSDAKKISFCGVSGALSIVILFLASITGIGTFAGPVLASVVLTIVLCEYKRRAAVLLYFTVSILSIIIMPDRELAVAYICLAWYPVIRDLISKIRYRLIRILLKSLVYCVSIGLFYIIVLKILGFDYASERLMATINIVLFLGGAFAFFLMDLVHGRIALLWAIKWRKKLLQK